MQSLTSQTFAEAMTLCSENIHYKACIVFENREAMNEFITEVRGIGNIPNVRRVITNIIDGARIEFINGSMIEIILGTENNVRGRKCHQLILAGDFEEELLMRLQSMTIPYTASNAADRIFNAIMFGKWVSPNDDLFIDPFKETSVSEELDEFLDSFVINEK